MKKFTPQAAASFQSNLIVAFALLIFLSVGAAGVSSYYIASQQIDANTENTISQLMRQYEQILNSSLYEIVDAVYRVIGDPEFQKALREHNRRGDRSIRPKDYILFRRAVSEVFQRNSALLDSAYFYLSGELIHIGYYSPTAALPLSRAEESIRRQEKSLHDLYWNNRHPSFMPDREELNVYSFCKLTGTPPETAKGLMVAEINARAIEAELDIREISRRGYAYFLDSSGSKGNRSLPEAYLLPPEEEEEILRRESRAFETLSTRGESLYVVSRTLAVTGWKMVLVIPQKELKAKVLLTARYLVLIFLLILAASLVLAHAVLSRILKPIKRLTGEMEKVNLGKMRIDSIGRSPKELTILEGGIRSLLNRLDALLLSWKEEHREKLKAEITVLQSQINPHFLYNTLDSIQQLCVLNEPAHAGEMVHLLADFYRMGLHQGEETTTLREELAHCRVYMDILTLRYPGEFDYRVECPREEWLETPLLKLILQPLLENAVYHGLREVRRKGTIRLSVERPGKDLLIRVEDNGKGMAPGRLTEVREILRGERESRAIGLRNVQSRIRLFYGPPYGLEIRSREGEGSALRLLLPPPRKEEL